MRRIRVIPALLLQGDGLVKTIKFKKPKYVGDPINTVKLFNDKEVDEIVVLDISATPGNREPNFRMAREIASECFMPLCFGGGIKSVDHAKKLFDSGIEKVAINSAAHQDPRLIEAIARIYGTQAVVVSIDAKKNLWGKYQVFTQGGKKNTKKDPREYAIEMEQRGAGEILLYSIDRDGTYKGYDIDLISYVSPAVNIPLIACGGASHIDEFKSVILEGQASAVAAGSLFVFKGEEHRAVLVNYPKQEELMQKLYEQI